VLDILFFFRFFLPKPIVAPCFSSLCFQRSEIAIKQTVHTRRLSIRRVPATLDHARTDLPTEKGPCLPGVEVVAVVVKIVDNPRQREKNVHC